MMCVAFISPVFKVRSRDHPHFIDNFTSFDPTGHLLSSAKNL